MQQLKLHRFTVAGQCRTFTGFAEFKALRLLPNAMQHITNRPTMVWAVSIDQRNEIEHFSTKPGYITAWIKPSAVHFAGHVVLAGSCCLP